jgi:hypothetical protein
MVGTTKEQDEYRHQDYGYQAYSGWVAGARYDNPFVKNTTDLVVNDLRSREVMGYNKYKKYLNQNTDENMLQHLYEELLDACMYIRTLIEQQHKGNKP